MAKYTGYVTVPTNTYEAWKLATNGNGYDVDGAYGCQCYDFASLFWYNVGFPQGYPVITSSSAFTMWNEAYRIPNSKYNGVDYFDLVYDVTQIKKGDVIVFNFSGQNPYGHVGFADVDYSDTSWTYPEFPVLSENNGGTPDPDGGAYVNVHGYDIRLFLGVYRYRDWETEPPTPPVRKKHRFPFVLYAKRLRDYRQNML